MDRAQEQWREVHPELVTDVSALAGRILRLAQHLHVSTDGVLLRQHERQSPAVPAAHPQGGGRP